MRTVRDIVTTLGNGDLLAGKKALAKKLGRTPNAVGNAVNDGKFRAAWYQVVNVECERLGIDEPPRELFDFLPHPEMRLD